MIITVDVDNRRALAALNRLLRMGADPSPVLKVMGEDLAESTKQRIASSGPGPKGEVWAENSPVTMALAAARGRPKKMGNHPLVDSGVLMDTVSYQVDGKTLSVGTDRFADDWGGGAAVLQFGTSRAGRGQSVTIPARPFLGLSNDDTREIGETVTEALNRAIRG